MRKRFAKKSAAVVEDEAKEVELKSSSTATTAASSFAAALDVILLCKENVDIVLSIDMLKALRLTCKSAKKLVDSIIVRIPDFHFSDFHRAVEVPPDSAQWPWPNITQLAMKKREKNENRDVQREFEYLLTVPLLKLKSLTVSCTCVMPLGSWLLFGGDQLPLFQVLFLSLLGKCWAE